MITTHSLKLILASIITLLLLFLLIILGSTIDTQKTTPVSQKIDFTKKEHSPTTNHSPNYKPQNLHLTQQEQAWIKQHPVINVGIDPFWAPIEFAGKNNQAEGISVQYLSYLEKILGLQFKISEHHSWVQVLDLLEQSKLDVLPAISILHSKQHSFHFTEPYLSIPNGIFSATDNTYLNGIEALKGKRIVVVKGYAILAWLETNHPELDYITSPSVENALRKVSRGDAFAFIGNIITTSYYIGQTGLTQIRVVGEVPYSNELAMAVRKDWKILATILNKGIAAIPQSKKWSIYNSWISIKYQHGIDYSLLWTLLGIAFFVLSIILYWNHRLAGEVTRRRKIEKELILAKQEAERASQSKSEFLANMSHEIRTPLNGIIGMGYLISNTELTLQQNTYIEKMHSSSDALLEVINDILDLSKGESGKLTLNVVNFNLRKNLQKVIDTLYTSAIEKGLSLQLHVDSHIPDNLIGDPQKLARILRNFGSNAIKFTTEGTVKLHVELIEQKNNMVQLEFSVSDTGIGISHSDQKKLFKPFSQLDNSVTRRFGGTGLGLVICQQLSDLMGGNIHITSTVGKGSTFIFSVKFTICKTQKSKIVKAIEEKIDKQDLCNSHILIVEDDTMNQLLTKEYLHSFGASTTIADNGEEAFKQLRKDQFDLILMDIQMPILDGYEATRLIRLNNKWKNLPIIALTAHALSDEQKKCYEVGMNDYVTKPIDPDKLHATVRQWIKHKTYV